jgi:hypothetical protein
MAIHRWARSIIWRLRPTRVLSLALTLARPPPSPWRHSPAAWGTPRDRRRSAFETRSRLRDGASVAHLVGEHAMAPPARERAPGRSWR